MGEIGETDGPYFSCKPGVTFIWKCFPMDLSFRIYGCIHISVSSCSSISSLFLSEELELDVELDFLKYLECSELLLERLDPLSSST